MESHNDDTGDAAVNGASGPIDVDLYTGLCTTRAIRRYTNAPVSDDALNAMLFAATRAPSGSNRQPFRFLVLRDGKRAEQAKALVGQGAQLVWQQKQTADSYSSGSGRDPQSPKSRMAASMQHYVDSFANVPVLVLGCLVRYRAPNPLEGASLFPACQNLLLAARALGLGGVLTGFHVAVEPQLRSLLDIPDDVLIGATITIGQPVGRHGPVRRRPMAELVFDGHWGGAAPWAQDPEGTRFTQSGPPTPAPR
jgi:nitroreductase